MKLCKEVKPVFCLSGQDWGNRICQQNGFSDLYESVMSLFTRADDVELLTYVVSKKPDADRNGIAGTLKEESGDTQLWRDIWQTSWSLEVLLLSI